MTLPLLLSVPHAGERVPQEVSAWWVLGREELLRDGDEGAAQIYGPLKAKSARFVTTDIARAVVDLNRAEDDRRRDGVVKTHTCFDAPVYNRPLSEDIVEVLLARYYRPYHRRLTQLADTGVRCGIDCHTMFPVGPPVGPDPGRKRPAVCLSNAEGTCPENWLAHLAKCFMVEFGSEVKVNDPFQGGYIIRAHAAELPWFQIELSRAPDVSNAEKGRRVLRALTGWCEVMGW